MTRGAAAELADRFAGPLRVRHRRAARARCGAGPNRMNRARGAPGRRRARRVRCRARRRRGAARGRRLRRPAQLATSSPRTPPRCSPGAGLPGARCCPGRCRRRCSRSPCAHLGAAAGVHGHRDATTRPQDNGYKVYWGDGAQIVPPADAEIAAAHRAVGPAGACPVPTTAPAAGARRRRDSTPTSTGVAHGRRAGPPARPADRYTPLHGVGASGAAATFCRGGLPGARRGAGAGRARPGRSRPSRSPTPRSRARWTCRSRWPSRPAPTS